MKIIKKYYDLIQNDEHLKGYFYSLMLSTFGLISGVFFFSDTDLIYLFIIGLPLYIICVYFFVNDIKSKIK